jgi:hypothetical protein
MKDISALTNITGNYLKTGNSPRFFVHVATSERKWATATSGDYTNRIQGIQSITDGIDAFGGMGTVSTANVDILKLGVGEEIKFYTSASIISKYQGNNVGVGRIKKANDTSYTTARQATSGDDAIFGSLIVGQQYVASPLMYRVYRGFLQFDIPSSITSCEEAYISFTGVTDASDTDFSIYVVLGTWTVGGLGVGSFDEFSGWVTGLTDFTGTILNEPYSTLTQFSLTDTNYIRLNRAGRQQIVTNTGSVLKLMLLSDNDYGGDAPTGNEYVGFGSVANVSPTLELIYNTVKPDNERARIYLGYNDISTGIPSTVSSMLNIWSGVVDSWSLDQRLLSLSMRHDDFKRNTKLTSDVITYSDSIYCPKENIGKSKPIVVGDFSGITHAGRIGSFLNESITTNRYGNGDFVKGYIYNSATSSAVFAGHALKTAGFFWSVWESSVESFVLLCGDLSEDADGKYSIGTGTAADFPYRMAIDDESNTIITPMQAFPVRWLEDYDASGLAVDGANAADSDYSNWSLLDSNTTLPALGDSATYQNYTPQWGVSELQHPVAIMFETSAASGYVSDAVNFAYTVYKEDGSILAANDAYIDADGQHIYYFDHTDLDQIRVQIMVFVRTHKDISAKPCKFRNICVAKAYTGQIPNEVFMKCTGLADDGSGTYTGTASALIENPSDVIRWFAMTKGSYIATEIDSSFTTARTALSGWKFAFQWSNDTGIENLFNYEGQVGIVDKLARQCNAVVFGDNAGKLKMKVFDATNSFAVSGTDVPADLDIFEYEGSPSSGSLTRHPLYSFNLDRITMDETYNSFILKYAQNYATNDYNAVLTIDNGLGVSASVSTNITAANLTTSSPLFATAALALTELKDLTSACYNDINTTNTLEFEAWAIRDEATATKLLQRLVQWHARRRFKLTLTTGLNAIAFELGDFINVRTDDIEDQFGTAFMECKKWKITKISTDLVGCKIGIEAVEAEIY